MVGHVMWKTDGTTELHEGRRDDCTTCQADLYKGRGPIKPKGVTK